MANDEAYRYNKTIYQWRCRPEYKMALQRRAITENRTANKILEDALAIYLVLDHLKQYNFLQQAERQNVLEKQ